MAVYFNVVPPLNNIHAVEHVVEALVFYGHSEIHVKHVEEDVWRALVRCGKSKIVHLMHALERIGGENDWSREL
jgi:hypothetical protein